MKLNKAAIKRWSTYANLGAMVVGAAMVYIPGIVATEYVPHVMCVCSGFVAICQFIKQGGLSAIVEEG